MNFSSVNTYNYENQDYFKYSTKFYCNDNINCNILDYNIICDYDLCFFVNYNELLTEKYNYDIFYYFNYFYYLNNLYYFLKFIILSGFTSLFVLFFVSKMYSNIVEEFENLYSQNPEYYDYDKFFFEYIDEYNNLDCKDINNNQLKKLKKQFLKLFTPKGEVIISYDYKNESFNYYSKKSNIISFEYLEVISRIYVTHYDCKSLYIEDDSFDIYKNIFNDNISNDNDNNNSDNNFNDNNNLKTTLFYSKSKKFNDPKKQIYKKNKYKYKGTIEYFNKICKFHSYKIDYYKEDQSFTCNDNYDDISFTCNYNYDISFICNDNDNSDKREKKIFFSLTSSINKLKKNNKNFNSDSKFEFEFESDISSNVDLIDYSDDSSFEDLNSFNEFKNIYNKEKNISFKNFKNKNN